jgi:hypothetical protein
MRRREYAVGDSVLHNVRRRFVSSKSENGANLKLRCPLLALSGHLFLHRECLLWEAKWTSQSRIAIRRPVAKC